ncbi:MAG: tetratricopeptide repeat protein [Clostridia bacterium]|nr:tetratricopeptide repeat protein [Clostridia bacterium]
MRTVGMCPACNKEIIMQAVCPNCGFNIDIFERAKRISINLYNRGLDEYNNGYILDSITTLEQSLNFYKNNIVARNLLGIIYYQIGEVGMALKHWVLSSNMKKEDNPATKYIQDMDKEKNILDKKNEACKIYNEALAYAKQGNDDIAVIRLQKAITLNPDLLKAYLLLMLCYYKDEETKDKAKQYLEKAKQIDKRSSLMKYYNKEICGEQIVTVKDKEDKKPKKEIVYKEKNSSMYFKIGNLNISKILVAIILTCSLSLLFSFKLGGFDKVHKNNVKLSEENKKYSQEIKDVKKQLDELTKELDEYKTEEKKAKDIKQLQEATEEYDAKNYIRAYELIKDIKEDLLSESNKETYLKLKSYLIKEVAREHYNNGKDLFEQEKYDEALEAFEKSLECTNTETFSAEVMYYMARVYEKLDKISEAKNMYSRIINEFGDSHSAETASYRLSLLKEND